MVTLALGLGLWIVWWLLAVDWHRVSAVLRKGGWIAVLLLAATTVLIWGSLSPTDQSLMGVWLPNYWAKATIVAGLIVIMLGCGALQMALCEAGETSSPGAGLPPQGLTAAGMHHH